jgi:hypothetical protein
MRGLPLLVLAAALAGAAEALVVELPVLPSLQLVCEQNGGSVHVEPSPARWEPGCVEIVHGRSVTWTNTGTVPLDPRSAQDGGACFQATRDRPGALLPGEAWTLWFRYPLGKPLQVSLDGAAWRDCLLAMHLPATGIDATGVAVAPPEPDGTAAGHLVVRRDLV